MVNGRSAADSLLFISTLSLLAIGIMMVYSASAVIAFHDFGDAFYYLKRQLIFAGLGIVAMIITMNVDYRFWRKAAKPGLILGFILLIIVLIPGIGVVRGGARSWLGISSFGIQPSEFIKMVIIIFLAKMLSEESSQITHFTKGLLPPLLIVGAAFGMIMLQPDLGTGAVLVGASMLMIYIAGARMFHLNMMALTGVAGLVGLVLACL